ASDHQLDGFALSHETRKPLRAASSRQYSEVYFRETDLSRVLARDANVSRHGDFKPTAHTVTVDRRDHQFGSVLKPQKHFIRVQAEVILEGRIDTGEHLDIRAGGEKLVSGTGQDDDVDVIVHTRFENGVVELTVHLVCVGVRGRIEH